MTVPFPSPSHRNGNINNVIGNGGSFLSGTKNTLRGTRSFFFRKNRVKSFVVIMDGNFERVINIMFFKIVIDDLL